ncbi:hypothetical protein [Govanella unica]|uniref:Uncharacterized protein n=1 Tax=Govanella unica TaxID=2975056 RepID=A0A9X3Z689_9PROT|nr:hypothetical protein [Govania unica]MDA5192753.1 hypothetical protein [Govania unica]
MLSRLHAERKIGAAFASAVTDLFLGRYDRLGRATETQPAVFHCAFLLDIIPRLMTAAEDFSHPTGAGLYFVRDRASAAHDARWWQRRPQGAYAAFLAKFQETLDIREARYLALLARNYVPRDRELYAFTYLGRLQQDYRSTPVIHLPQAAEPFTLISRRVFTAGYPLVIDRDIYMPNHDTARFEQVPLRSLSRGIRAMPMLLIREDDAHISSVNHAFPNS